MGTQYHVTVVADGVDANQLKAQLDQRLRQINRVMSTYDPESELMRVNSAQLASPIAISDELAEVLSLSLSVYKRTRRRFDVTVGPLVNRWGFGPVETQGIPTDAEVKTLLQRVGSDALELVQAPSGWQLTKHKPVFIDLSAVAKGWGVDQLANFLSAAGFNNFLVEIGGELRVKGHNAHNQPWAIAIERPNLAHGSVQEAISVTDKAVATSGSYRNYQMYNGVQYSHTIDPQTGKPITHKMVSITVLADNCAEADALATGLNVLGPDEALQLAEQWALPVFILVEKDGEVVEYASSQFKPYLAQ